MLLVSWKRHAMEAFAHYWPFVMGIPGNTLIPLTEGQKRVALMLSLL